jgi:hypothetical protein
MESCLFRAKPLDFRHLRFNKLKNLGFHNCSKQTRSLSIVTPGGATKLTAFISQRDTKTLNPNGPRKPVHNYSIIMQFWFQHRPIAPARDFQKKKTPTFQSADYSHEFLFMTVRRLAAPEFQQ